MCAKRRTAEPQEIRSDANDSHPLVLAYRVGRTLQRLHFNAIRAWIGVSGADYDVCNSFDELTALVRQTSTVESRESAQEQIAAQRQNVVGIMGAAWRAELLDACNSDLEAEFRLGDSDFGARRACSLLFAPIEELVDTLHRNIEALLDSDGRLAINFGCCVERGLCHAELFRARAAQAEAEKSAREAVKVWFGEAATGAPENYVVEYCLPNFASIGLLRTWWADLRQRWNELRFAIDLAIPDWPTPGVEDDYSTIPLSIIWIDRTFREAAGHVENQPSIEVKQSPPGYLGLTLDIKRCILSREGRTEQIDLTSLLKLQILKFFIKMADSYSPRSELIKAAWGDELTNDNVLDNELTEIRKLLLPLSIRIKNKPRIGWRLEECQSPASKRKQSSSTGETK